MGSGSTLVPTAPRCDAAQIGQARLEALGIVRPPSDDAMLPPAKPLAPTPERRQHDRIVREAGEIKGNNGKSIGAKGVVDSDGGIGRPYRVVDTLALMERRGTISAEMRAAGEEFRDDFALGRLDALKAADMERAGLASGSGPYAGLSIGHRAELARTRVWASIRKCGGIGSPGGSCIWHVLGWGMSLSEWAQTQGWAGRFVSREAAGGILAAALGTLVEKSA